MAFQQEQTFTLKVNNVLAYGTYGSYVFIDCLRGNG